MRSRAAPRAPVEPSCASLEIAYVTVLRMDNGATIQSVVFADRETAEKVAKYSLLDADVVEARVEEVWAKRPVSPAPLPPW